MARDKTVELNQKIISLLGCTIPALDRLNELDDALWKLNLFNEAKVRFDVSYSKAYIFGYSRRVTEHIDVKIDDALIEAVVSLYKEEYDKQVQVCEELIRKLKSK